MEQVRKDPLYSDKYKTTDFTWGQTLGEGKYIISKNHVRLLKLQALFKYLSQTHCLLFLQPLT